MTPSGRRTLKTPFLPLIMKSKNPISVLIAWVAVFGHSPDALSRNSPPADSASIASANAAGAGRVEGRVLNATSGKYLNNARIAVEGTALTTFTDQQGHYQLSNVPSGEVTLRVSVLGLGEQKANVVVSPARVVRQDFNLNFQGETAAGTDGATVMAKFTVEAEQMTAQMLALNEQRYAPNIKNVVSADEFGTLGEGNLGELLRMIPGMNIATPTNRPENIGIRGLPASDTLILLDGGEMANASTNAATRVVDLESLQMNNMDRVEITKVPTPDLPSSSLGGTINVISKGGFDRRTPEFRYKVYSLFNSRTYHLSAPERYRPDLRTAEVQPGFDLSYIAPINKSFAVSFSAAMNTRVTSNEIETLAWNRITGVLIENDIRPGTGAVLGILRKANAALSFDWKISNTDTLGVRLQYYRLNTIAGTTNFVMASGAGATGDATFFQGAPNGVGSVRQSFPSNFNQLVTTPTFNLTYRHRGPIWNIESQASYSKSDFTARDVEEGFLFNVSYAISNLVLRGEGMGTRPGQMGPTKLTAVDRTGAPVDVLDTNLYTLSNVSSTHRDIFDVRKYAKIDVGRSFYGAFPFSLKTGVAVNQQEKDLKEPNFTWNFRPTADADSRLVKHYDIVSDIAYPSTFGGEIRPISPTKLFKLFQERPDYFVLDEAAAYLRKMTSSKYLRETISAAYLRGDFRGFNNRLWLVTGVRYERTEDGGDGTFDDISATYSRDAQGNLIRNAAGALVPIPGLTTLQRNQLRYQERAAHSSKSYDGFYPSLNSSFEITGNVVARAAYAKTIGRPNLTLIIPGVTFSDPNGSDPKRISVVNTALRPRVSDSIDLSLESYFTKGGFGTIGVFQKKIKDFWGSVRQPATAELLAQYGLPVDDYIDYDLTFLENTGTAVVKGLELNYRHSLSSLHRYLRGLQVFFNFTSLKLSGPRTADFSEFSPQSTNMGLSYFRPKFALKLNWSHSALIRRGLVAVGPANGVDTYTYFAPRIRVGMSGEYRISPRLTLDASVSNLNNSRNIQQAYGPDTPAHARQSGYQEYGADFTVGIKGTF